MDALTATALAMDATPDAKVAVEIGKAADLAAVAVIDDGCPMARRSNGKMLRRRWISQIAANRRR